tara:strand:- start:327 stop:620 length:294 start_codon:yes stop_codon:yes gene_type:complete
MRTIITYILFAGIGLGVMFVAAIPWPSTVYILFGACESSAQYVAGECSVNTHNWDWCVTDTFMEKMPQSDCNAANGQLYYKEKIAKQAFLELQSANN